MGQHERACMLTLGIQGNEFSKGWADTTEGSLAQFAYLYLGGMLSGVGTLVAKGNCMAGGRVWGNSEKR